jgi:RNA polymerase sigma-70 factor (ECF subfamily)
MTATTFEHVRGVTHAWLGGDAERRRLVRLCAAVTGDRDAAEDLAQETLLEAWRNAHKLHDPDGADRWLSAIARNVCRRWARRRGRELPTAPEEAAADATDLDADLERAELVELLDSALSLLSPEAREVLVQRYVDDAPHAEIAERLGLSEDAVSMRLTRGKALLRRLLAPDLGETEDGWRETRVWCSECGQRKLLTLREPPPGVVSFRCPGCSPDGVASELQLANAVFARLVGDVTRPTAIIGRTADWSRMYYGEGATAPVDCTGCGRVVHLRRYFEDRHGRPSDGLYADCEACGTQVSSSARGIALAQPAVRRFRRDHPRMRSRPPRAVDFGGAPALAVRYEDVLGSAGADVVFARDTLRVLHVATG